MRTELNFSETWLFNQRKKSYLDVSESESDLRYTYEIY